MNPNSLRKKASLGFIWSITDRFFVNIGQLLISIILARILSPSDFGLVAMLYVFLAVSEVFINSGMGSALIQRENIKNIDYSTIFVFNLVVSVLIYILIFVSAPLIAYFYGSPQLIDLTRVLGITLIINAFGIVQRSHLQKQIDIKSLAKVNIFSLIVSGTMAIFFAYQGYGVWALVIQAILNSILSAFLLYYFSSLKISFKFSWSSFNSLFKYSSNLLLAGLFAQLLQQVNSLVIGKTYTASQLGFYSQAKKLADSSSGTLSSILNVVTFPLFALVQNDKERMVGIFRRMIGLSAFITLPIMILVALLSNQIVQLILGNKWSSAGPILMWLALARTTVPLSTINLNILKATGRSDLFLKVDLIKAPIIILALIITAPISIDAIVIGIFITSLISYSINAYLSGRLYGYGMINQFKDMFKTIVSTLMMSISVYLSLKLNLGLMAQILSASLIGFIVYITVAYLLKTNELKELISVIKERTYKLK